MWGENWGEMIWGGGSAAAVQIPFGPWTLLILGFILGICAVYANRSRMARVVPFAAILLIPAVGVVAVNLPYTFSNGSIADANQVNENFQTLRTEIAAIKGTAPVISSVVGMVKASHPGFLFCDVTWTDPEDAVFVVEYCHLVDGNPLSWCGGTRTSSSRFLSTGGNAEVPNNGSLVCRAKVWDGFNWSEEVESAAIDFSF